MAKNRKNQDGRSHALQRRENIVSYLFLAPALLFFVCFVVLPMGMGIVTSLFNYTMKSPVSADTFVGLKNYITLFQDPVFLKALVNTFILVIVAVPAVTLFSLWVGSSIYEMHGGLRSFFRCVFYLPVVTGTVAVVVVWRWMFDSYNGIFNYILKAIGLIDQNIMWLGDTRFALGCIILILFTTSVGQPIVLYVAALGNVDQSLVEAAEVDGATPLQKFFRITVPMLANTTFVVAILLVIEAFNMFESIFIMTAGGPLGSTSTIMYYIYEQGFTNYDMGYASALAWIFFALIMVVTLIQYRFRNEQGGE